jgi:arginyl-tRNA synthetase
MEITKKITNLLTESLNSQEIDSANIDIVVEAPNDMSKGDYATNVAMRLSSQLKQNPMNIAQSIVENLPKDIDIEEVEVAPPGFINFTLSNRYYLAEIAKIIGNGEYFKLDQRQNEKVVIEYTDANPFKEFHIGHLYSNAVGESFSRLQEALGADVTRACYQGDVGLHVAKSIWGLEKKLTQENKKFEELEKLSLEQRVKYLGEAYVLGAHHYDELKDESAIKETDDLNYYIFSLTSDTLEKRDFSEYEKRNVAQVYKKGRQWCLDFFEKIYEKVDTKFDHYFFESEVGEAGLKIVLDNIEDIFEKDQGAIIYRGDEKKNLHTRVFVNSYGLPTYEAKEIGLALKKEDLLDYDESVVITADEQSGYFKVVLDALSKIRPDVAKKIKHFAHGKVKLPGNSKMSSRKGGILSGEWLINETKVKVKEVMKKNGKISGILLDRVSEKVAIGAIKYAFLKVSIGRDIVFDFDKSISFDGDTGPYLMYVYARCASILKEAGKLADPRNVCLDPCMDNAETRGLVSTLSKYREALLDSSTNYAPSILTQYLFSLGQSFNSFYQNVRVLDASDEQREILLLIVKATMLIMKDGLDNLGIDVVQKM